MKRKIVFRLILCIISVVATIATVTDRLPATGGDGMPIPLFFTVWSVWFVSVISFFNLYYTISREKESGIFMLLWYCSVISIIATFLVTAITYALGILYIDYWSWGSIFKHILLPLFAFFDAKYFRESKTFERYYPYVGPIPAFLYWVVILSRIFIKKSRCGGVIPESDWTRYYPYKFVNLDANTSLIVVLGILAGIYIMLTLLGILFFHLNSTKKI